MARFFNTAGPCFPGVHYMLPPEARLPELRRLVDQGAYFVVHAPRQSGKTTCLRLAAQSLMSEGGLACLYTSCESGASLTGDAEIAVSALLSSLEHHGAALPEPLRPPAIDPFAVHAPHSRLLRYLAAWSERCPRPVVLFLDEIDALSGEGLLAILRQLRQGYTDRPRRFPQALALIGLRDVRDYKILQNQESTHLGTASPFNIKVESLTLRDFTATEVASLCQQHEADTGQVFTAGALVRIHELTHGQPWLVNALARQVVEVEAPDRRQAIDETIVERAKERLILRRDTHLDSLAERLRETRVRRVVAPLLTGGFLSAEVSRDDLDYVVDLGLLRWQDGNLVVANPIYREVIPRTLSEVLEASLPIARPDFISRDGHLRFDRLLYHFRAFWLEHAESFLAKAPYSEAAAQLIFMAYLHKVVNGGGFIDREYAVGRGRIDLCLRWPHPEGTQRFAIELKVRRGAADVVPQGLDQLAAYLDRLGLAEGTLVVFDAREDGPAVTERDQETLVDHQGHQIRVLVL